MGLRMFPKNSHW